jgi:hypothetical protein
MDSAQLLAEQAQLLAALSDLATEREAATSAAALHRVQKGVTVAKAKVGAVLRCWWEKDTRASECHRS